MAKKVTSTVPEENTPNPFTQFIDKQSAKAVASGKEIDPEIIKASGAPAPIEYEGIEQYNPSLPEGYFDPYEDYIDPHTLRGGNLSIEEMNQMRFDNQTLGQEVGHALGRVALNVVPQIISGFSSMVDVPGYFDAEHAATNSIVNWANDLKKDVDENLLPIYTDPNGDTMDLTSSAWWASRGSGLAESVLSFLAQGAGMGKALNLIGKGVGSALKGEKLLAAIEKIPGVKSGANTMARVGQGTKGLAGAVALNQSEAVIEASQVYKQTYDDGIKANLDPEEARQRAANAASTTMNLNRINILLNLSSASAFLTPLQTTRNLLKASTLGGTVGHLAKEMTQEGAEELINHVASQAGLAEGKKKEYTLNDAIKDMGSMQGMEAAFLGAIGGLAQTGGTELLQSTTFGPGAMIDENGNKISKRAWQNQQYQKQQDVINDLKAKGVKVNEALKNIKDSAVYYDQLSEALKSGDTEAAKKLMEDSFDTQVLKAAETGTVGVLEDMYKAEAARDVNEVGEEYIQNAKDAVNNLRRLESVYNNYSEYTNVNDLFFNRANAIRNNRILDLTKKAAQEDTINLDQDIRNIARKYSFDQENNLIIKNEGQVVEVVPRTKKVPLPYTMNDLENNPGTTEENKAVYDQFLKEVQELPAYKKSKEYEDNISSLEANRMALDKQLEELKSPKAQEEAAEKQKVKEELTTATNNISKINSIQELKDLKTKFNDEGFNKLADSRITELKAQQVSQVKSKKINLAKQQIVEKLKTATEEDLEALRQEATNLKIPQKDIAELLNKIDAKADEFAGKEPAENPLEGFTVNQSADEEEVENRSKAEDTEIPSGIPEPNQDAERKSVTEEVEKLATEIAEDRENTKESLGGKIYDYFRAKIGAIRAAYLSREFNQRNNLGVITREEITNEIQNLQVLDPNKFTPGTKITLKVNTGYKGSKYNPASDTKETFLWSEREQELIDKYGEENYRQSDEYLDEVPIIAIDENGNEAFYVHDVSWIKEENLANDEKGLEEDRNNLRAIRREVINKGSVDTTITFKGNGRLICSVNNQQLPASEAMPDSDLIINVAQDGIYHGPQSDLETVGPEPQQGRVYAMVPIGPGKQTAIPLSRTTLKDDAVESIIQAIEAHLSGDENNPIVQEVSRITNGRINLLDITGINRYISQFTRLTPTNKNEGLEPLLNRVSDKLDSNHYLIAVTGNSIQFGRPKVSMDPNLVDKRGSKAATISINFENTEAGKQGNKQRLTALRVYLKKMLSNVDKGALVENGDIALISTDGQVSNQKYTDFVKSTHTTNILSVNIGTEENPKWAYTIQPTILFSDDFVSANTKQVVKPAVTTAAEEVGNAAVNASIDNQAKDFISANPTVTVENIENLLEQIQQGTNVGIAEADISEAILVFNRVLNLLKNSGRIVEEIDGIEINIPDIDISEYDEDGYDGDLEDEAAPDLSEKQIKQQRQEIQELLIKGLDPRSQESLISYLSALITKEALENKNKTGKSSVDTKTIFDKQKAFLTKVAALLEKKGLENRAKRITTVLSQWEKVKNLVRENLSLLDTGTITKNYDAVDGNEAGLERTSYSDDFTFTVNSKNTASADLRKFFAFVEAVDENNTPITTILSLPEIVPFDTVYDTLHEILANKPADYETMMKILQDRQKTYPWIQNVIKKLDEAPEKIKNEFVSDMAKFSLKMEFVMWSKDYNGNYSLGLWSSNASAIEQRLRNMWSSNLKGNFTQSNLITTGEDDNYVFNETVAKGLIAQAEEWKKNPPSKDKEGIQQLTKWLGNFGIVLSDRTYDDLIQGKFKNRSVLSWQGLFNSSNGLVNILSKKLDVNLETKNIDDVELFTDTVIQNLAKFEARNVSNVFSNSFQSGGKSIYSYTNGNYALSRMRDLTALNPDGTFVNQDLINKLKQISFSSDSLWLSELTADDSTGALMRDSLGLGYVSLEALKQQFTPTQDNRKLNKLTNGEHEVVKLGMFFNNTLADTNNGKRRIVSFLYPTMSDKSTMTVIRTLAQNIKLTDGKLSKESLELLYKAVVLPELNRMMGKQPSDIKGYEPNYFYFMPSLNSKEVTIGEETKSIRDFALDGKAFSSDLKDFILDELQEVFTKLVDDKLTAWDKLGVGKTNKETNDIHTFLNKGYMSNIARGVTSAEKVRYAASDFVFNYLIANSEAFKVIAGDPALFYKKSSKENATIMDDIEETYINLGKRLAKDIAPGLELADSQHNKYYQVFFNDKKMKSNNVSDPIQKAYFDKIIKNFSKNYSGIEGSDAQEYTTWREHLYVLNQLGRITEKQHNTIKTKLENNENLSSNELGLVFQPLKPVYTGNITDTDRNVDRVVYIKSSSFPLIPQLTAGLEIDKVRAALEKFENNNKSGRNADGTHVTVRASFGTANKVGAIKNGVDVFNDDGSVKDDLTITESNTLLLPRSNFRIQQDVPYKIEKNEINVGTQERKLLFVNMLDVEIEPGVSGKELFQSYNNAYENLFVHKYEKLMERFGLVETTVEGKFDSMYETSEDSTIFDRIIERDNQIANATNPVSKKAIKAGFEEAEGELEAARADYINKNFDKIVEMLSNNNVETLFVQKDKFEQNCD
jgi:hypothetical protein